MEHKTAYMETLLEKVEAYGKTSFELFKLKTLDKFSYSIAKLASNGIILLFLVLFIVTLNVGVALWLGDILGKSYYGFFCVAGFYALIGGGLWLFLNKALHTKINQIIISHMLQLGSDE
ncbi:MAG: hypothetical protein V4538_06450 [Bacteroidota bacterium]